MQLVYIILDWNMLLILSSFKKKKEKKKSVLVWAFHLLLV
jgi:hypothetical protein